MKLLWYIYWSSDIQVDFKLSVRNQNTQRCSKS